MYENDPDFARPNYALEPYAQKIEITVEVPECGEPGVASVEVRAVRAGIAIWSEDIVGLVNSLVCAIEDADPICVDRESYLRSIEDVLLEHGISSRVDVPAGDGQVVDMVVDWNFPVLAEIRVRTTTTSLTEADLQQIADLFHSAQFNGIDPAIEVAKGMHLSLTRAVWFLQQAQERGLVPGPA